MRERLRTANNEESKTEVMLSLLRKLPALVDMPDSVVFSNAVAAKYEEYKAEQVRRVARCVWMCARDVLSHFPLRKIALLCLFRPSSREFVRLGLCANECSD